MNKIKEELLSITDQEFSKLLEKLSTEQFFKIKEEEINTFKNKFKETAFRFDELEKINTKDTEPLNYPIHNLEFHLRSDKKIREFDTNEWVDSKKHNNDNYIEVEYEK